MRKIACILFALAFAGCKPSEGERCNPLAFSDECHPNSTNTFCVYPVCSGVAYCCALDPDGGIVSKDPNCQCAPADLGGTD